MKNKIIGSLLFLLCVLDLYVIESYQVLQALYQYSEPEAGLFLVLIAFAVCGIGVTLFCWEEK